VSGSVTISTCSVCSAEAKVLLSAMPCGVRYQCGRLLPWAPHRSEEETHAVDGPLQTPASKAAKGLVPGRDQGGDVAQEKRPWGLRYVPGGPQAAANDHHVVPQPRPQQRCCGTHQRRPQHEGNVHCSAALLLVESDATDVAALGCGQKRTGPGIRATAVLFCCCCRVCRTAAPAPAALTQALNGYNWNCGALIHASCIAEPATADQSVITPFFAYASPPTLFSQINWRGNANTLLSELVSAGREPGSQQQEPSSQRC
jgi:hypothetical protein